MMVFGHNRSKIPADRFPEFPEMKSEKAHVRKGRLSKTDYETFRNRFEDPLLFWLKVFFVMTFKYGFRKGELLKAKCHTSTGSASTFTLPAFTTKNSMERVVDVLPNGEIFDMLVALTAGRALMRLYLHAMEGRCETFVASGKTNHRHEGRLGQRWQHHDSRPTPERNHQYGGEGSRCDEGGYSLDRRHVQTIHSTRRNRTTRNSCDHRVD